MINKIKYLYYCIIGYFNENFFLIKQWFKAYKTVKSIWYDETEMEYEIFWIKQRLETAEYHLKDGLCGMEREVIEYTRLLRLASLIHNEYAHSCNCVRYSYNFGRYVNPRNLSHYEVRDGFEWIDKARNIYNRLKTHIFVHI